MLTGHAQDPEGAKTIILSYKTATRAVAAIHRQNFKMVYFTDTQLDVLRVDKQATTGE